jgi:hypothetical protein
LDDHFIADHCIVSPIKSFQGVFNRQSAKQVSGRMGRVQEGGC